jgi:hypothetical protein
MSGIVSAPKKWRDALLSPNSHKQIARFGLTCSPPRPLPHGTLDVAPFRF